MATTMGAPRTIVITVPAKSGLTFRKPTTVSIQGQGSPAQSPPIQQRFVRAPSTVGRLLPVTTTFVPAALGKRAASDMENTDPFIVIQPPRKRERLTHLTPEEKLNRRKLKNRVAAQTARDRKKVRTISLEDTVQQLNDDNQQLLAENKQLRQRMSQLSAENARLKKAAQRIVVDQEDEKPPKIDNMARGRTSDAFGSAVGSSVSTVDPEPVRPSDGMSDIDLQRILDDLLSGTEFFNAAGAQLDALGDQLGEGTEGASAVDADAAGDVSGGVEGVETQAAAGNVTFVPLDVLKLDIDDEPNTPDAFISGLPASPSTVAADQRITQLVPGSPYQNPTSPVTPMSTFGYMPLLDADLIDKTLDKHHDVHVDTDLFLEAPVWEDTFTDLFELVA